MAFNGSGSFTLVAGNPVVTGTTISSTWANNTLSDIATGLSTTITKDGQTMPTANIPLGGFKLTGVGAATVNGDALRFENLAPLATTAAVSAAIQAQTYTAFTTGGTGAAYTLTTVPAAAALVANQRYQVLFHLANTSATPTLARDGLAATALKVYNSVGIKANPAIGAFAINMLADVVYDGTDFVVEGIPISGSLAQAPVTTQTGTVATGTTVIPADNTIPQITEGVEFMTLAFTPKIATSRLEIEVNPPFSPPCRTSSSPIS